MTLTVKRWEIEGYYELDKKSKLYIMVNETLRNVYVIS